MIKFSGIIDLTDKEIKNKNINIKNFDVVEDSFLFKRQSPDFFKDDNLVFNSLDLFDFIIC